jgi:phytoene desaturase
VKEPVIIVGGGLGGLAAAIHLALQGLQVIVLEKNERVGGKLDLIREDGYTFDTGPSLLTMPWVLRELFAAAGRRLEDELTLLPIEPICRYYWPDGMHFNASQQLPLLLQEIARFDRRDQGNWFRFMAYAERIYRVVASPFLLEPFDGLRDLLSLETLRNFWKIDPFRTVDQAVRSYFRSPYLQQIFNRYATYNGSSPYHAPATFNLIAYIEMAEGGWYVRGGMYELARALERLALELGVMIHTRSPVARIGIYGGRAGGVVLENGERLSASAVVVNADPRYAYEQLLPPEWSTARKLARLEPSSSGFVLLLGIDRVYEQLAHHTIFFSKDYPAEFKAIFDQRIPAPDPTVYVCATSQSDPQHAPSGHMNLFVLVNTPALHTNQDWGAIIGSYRDTIVRKLEKMGLIDLERHIRYERIISPEDLQQRYNAPNGAIYGLASNRPWTAFVRPPLRAPEARDLYFVGGGTHPGGGIPLVLLSGRAVTKRLLHDQQKPRRLR